MVLIRSRAFAGAVLACVAALAPLRAQSGSAPRGYTDADVAFVQGMIGHHAQAVTMSDWAPTHGASPAILTLCRRIALSQRDEIAMMQRWLQERHLPTPDPLHTLPGDSGAAHRDSMAPMAGMPMSGMSMPGMAMNDHATMPGMLTAAQMRQLDAAHGAAFDRLYLEDMIQHHEGALQMVASLSATPGSDQQPDLSGFVTDVDAGQRAEIGRMQAMLNTLPFPRNQTQ